MPFIYLFSFLASYRHFFKYWRPPNLDRCQPETKNNFICRPHCIINLSFSRWRRKRRGTNKKSLRYRHSWERLNLTHEPQFPKKQLLLLGPNSGLYKSLLFPPLLSAHLWNERRVSGEAGHRIYFGLLRLTRAPQEIFALIRQVTLPQKREKRRGIKKVRATKLNILRPFCRLSRVRLLRRGSGYRNLLQMLALYWTY